MSQVLLSNRQTRNWQSMVERIKREIHRSAASDEVAIKLAICDAIGFFKTRVFRFNDGISELTTTGGRGDYGPESVPGQGDGYPADMVELRDITTNDTSSSPVLRPRGWSYYLDQASQNLTTGSPDFYTFYGNRLYLYPVPNDALVLKIHYLKDIGTPTWAFADGEFIFYAPSGAVISNSFTNAWFNEAETLIRARAKWDLFANHYNDLSRAGVQDAIISTELLKLRREMRGTNKFIPQVNY